MNSLNPARIDDMALPGLGPADGADAILNALPVPVLQVDADNQIIEGNAAARPFSSSACRPCAGTRWRT